MRIAVAVCLVVCTPFAWGQASLPHTTVQTLKALHAPFLAFDTLSASYDICVSDFTGDGREDIVACSPYTSAVALLRGEGKGQFSAPDAIEAGSGSQYMACGDLNGDGHLDIVSGSSALLATGDGTFASALPVDYGFFYAEVRLIADLDGDGKQDLMAGNASGPFAVLLGHGDGTFDPAQLFSIAANDFVVGRMNGDAFPDLVLVTSGANRVSIYPGLGNGSFGPPQNYTMGFGPNGVALADLNRDGLRDVVTTTDSEVVVRLGNGDGTLQESTTYSAGSGVRAPVVTDLDGDDRPDVLVLAYYDETVNVLIGDGSGGLLPRTPFPVANEPWSAAAGDFDSDGVVDVVVTDRGFNQVAVLHGEGDGSFGYQNDTPLHSFPTVVRLADFDGDARADVAVAHYGDASIAVLKSLGDGTLGEPSYIADAGGSRGMGVGDLDHDGHPDLVVGYQSVASISVIRGLGSLAFAPHVDYPVPGGTSALELGDLNGDGHLDVACSVWSGSLCVVLGDGLGGLAPPIIHAVSDAPVNMALADLNEDGKLDLVSCGNYTLETWAGNGDGTLARPVLLEFAGAAGVAVADFDLDGNLDVAVAKFGVDLYRGHGDGSFDPALSLATGKAPSNIVAGDVNRDGKPDLLALNGYRNTVTYLRGKGTLAFGPGVDLGIGGMPYYSIAIGLLNADVWPDLVAPGYFSNSVHVLLNARKQP